jgi:hypothetical protein
MASVEFVETGFTGQMFISLCFAIQQQNSPTSNNLFRFQGSVVNIKRI